MPHNPIRVVVSPANYFSHPGSFNHLHDFFTDEQLSRAVWIYGERAIAAAQTKLPPAFELPGVKHILFRGHCSESDVQQLAAESGDDRSVVIGVGGGALLDTASPRPPSRSAVCYRSDDRRYLRRLDTALCLV